MRFRWWRSSSVFGVPARLVRLVSSGSRFLGIEGCQISFSVWRSLAFLSVRQRVNRLRMFLSPASVCYGSIRRLKARWKRLVAREKFCFLVSCDRVSPRRYRSSLFRLRLSLNPECRSSSLVVLVVSFVSSLLFLCMFLTCLSCGCAGLLLLFSTWLCCCRILVQKKVI